LNLPMLKMHVINSKNGAYCQRTKT